MSDTPRTATLERTREFSGNRRFKPVRKLGEGGMGAVYECDDLETGARVALKTLLFSGASTLLSFKDEFRQFQHIHHPNLVSLGELYEEAGLWFFTMELVKGVDFLAYARTGGSWVDPASPVARTLGVSEIPPPLEAKTHQDGVTDYAKLRQALRQLAMGLNALHAAGKVHRDVKPSNVLVTNEGRAVLLDFGVAVGLSRSEQLDPTDIMGTPLYMAPEQAAGMPVTQAADWYAVGTMLFEALTGALPFGGTLFRILQEKQWRPAPDPRTIAPDIPADLAQLVVDLLATKPEDRPTSEALAARLELAEAAPPISTVSLITRSDVLGTPFVGRSRELEALSGCFERVRERHEALAAYVQGESGVGKSSLVGKFVDDLRDRFPEAVVLAGACYEHEAVPYKAVDGIVDALSSYLARLPQEEAARLLPRHAALLSDAFQVLGRVEAFAELPRGRSVELDPLEQRSRIFAALRELLARLADRSPLVLCIDDLQWADADSLALLGEILRPPDSAALLLVATVRRGTADADELPPGPASLPARGAVLSIGRLGGKDSRDLVERLSALAGRGLDSEAIIREAQGHPLFLAELVRYHAMKDRGSSGPVQLDEMLGARVEALDGDSRRLLEVVALAPAAMMQLTATKTAVIQGADAIKHVKLLKAAHLVRTTGGTRGTDLIEPYHARIRDVVCGRLSDTDKRGLHRRIAVVMETTGQREPEDLAVHWREAGESERAADYALKAATRAEGAFAFDRAANYLRMAIELAPPVDKERRALSARLGHALGNAGRPLEAAEAFRAAAVGATPVQARELARRAAEHLLRSGHVDEGLAELQKVLATVDVSYPRTTRGTIASLVWSSAKLKVRGLRFKAVDEAQLPADTLARIDACWAATTGLFVVDQLRGVDFHHRHLLFALSAGEPSRVTRGLAYHAIVSAVTGAKELPEARRLLDLARSASQGLSDPLIDAILEQTDGTVAYLTGDFATALSHGRVAMEILRSRCRGVVWELATTRQQLFWSLAFMGRLQELIGLTGPDLRETLEAGDHYSAMSIRSGLPNVVWLASGESARARREADESIGVWPSTGTFLQHLIDLVAQVNIDLYEGANAAAHARVASVRPRLEKAGLLRVEFNRVLVTDIAARAAIAKARVGPKSERGALLDEARHEARTLRGESAAWAHALAASIEASIAMLEGSKDEASRLAELAMGRLAAASLDVYAAACAHLTGQGTPEQRGLFARERVAHADRFASVFFPGGGDGPSTLHAPS